MSNSSIHDISLILKTATGTIMRTLNL
ncbi:hypothetical protein [Xenorhabdus bovienii]